jgi:integrase
MSELASVEHSAERWGGFAVADAIVPKEQASLAELQELAERAMAHAEGALAANSRRAYSRHWQGFTSWCEGHGLDPLPADGRTVALWLTELASEGLSVATMAQALAAVARAHRAAELPPPSGRALEDTWAGIRRELGVAPNRKAPLLTDDLARALEAIDGDSMIELRDRALLLVGFGGALRRSELAALEVRDLSFEAEGVAFHLRRSKTDQEGQGRDVGIPHRLGKGLHPVQALRRWLEAAGIDEGPVFRRVDRHGNVGISPLRTQSIAKVVKRRAAAVGLDPANVSGHSLRAGLVTSAAKVGKPLPAIMAQTGHRNVGTVQGYIRRATLFEDNAAEGLR